MSYADSSARKTVALTEDEDLDAMGEGPETDTAYSSPAGQSPRANLAIAKQAPSTAHPHGLMLALRSIINVIVVALFIVTFTVQPFRIPSASMEPTLLVGDFLMVDKQVGFEQSSGPFAPAGLIHRGDVVIFHYPVNPALHLVKRVIGLPGDRLRMRDGHVFVNETPLSEPYAVYRTADADKYRDQFPMLANADPAVDSRWWIEMHSLVSAGELTVPAGDYFVLGDNRNDSDDSRYWGFVPRSAIVGRPLLVYFSLNTSEPGLAQSVAAMSGTSRQKPADSLAGFARWDRVFHRVD